MRWAGGRAIVFFNFSLSRARSLCLCRRKIESAADSEPRFPIPIPIASTRPVPDMPFFRGPRKFVFKTIC
uniref:Putative secreted protein n=1 Tax=Anopheles darlingi TaxID=43151 RepID=A0A2M4DPF4_ANODA